MSCISMTTVRSVFSEFVDREGLTSFFLPFPVLTLPEEVSASPTFQCFSGFRTIRQGREGVVAAPHVRQPPLLH